MNAKAITPDELISKSTLQTRIADLLSDTRKTYNAAKKHEKPALAEMLEHLDKRRGQFRKSWGGDTPMDDSFQIAEDTIRSLFPADAETNEVPAAKLKDILDAIRREAASRNKQADRLWEAAREIGNSTPANYQRLGNSIIERAIADYELAVSGNLPSSYERPPEYVIREVTDFARDYASAFTSVNVPQVLRTIKATYLTQFVPMVEEHAAEIIEEINVLNKKKSLTPHDRAGMAKYTCPLCGYALKKRKEVMGYVRIGCMGCNLSAITAEQQKGSETV